MKNTLNKISCKGIMCTLKGLLGLAVGLSIIYSFAAVPLMTKMYRSDCHEQTFLSAQALGNQILEQNKDNTELTEQQVQQEVNALVTQTYEANYVLCLRSRGI